MYEVNEGAQQNERSLLLDQSDRDKLAQTRPCIAAAALRRVSSPAVLPIASFKYHVACFTVDFVSLFSDNSPSSLAELGIH